MKTNLRMLSLLMLLAAFGQVHAQTWPNRPVRFILSQAPGTAPDIICRFITDRLSKAIGQPIVIDNRGGGGNVIGATAAARSAPDG